MRRFALLTALSLSLLPGLALAQTDNGSPPPPPPPGDDMGGPGMPPPGPGDWGPGGKGHGPHHGGPEEFINKFYAANTTHDDKLTLAQAKAADMRPIVDHFADIDTAHRGYVTFNDVEAWHLEDMAKHLEKRAGELRAEDK